MILLGNVHCSTVSSLVAGLSLDVTQCLGGINVPVPGSSRRVSEVSCRSSCKKRILIKDAGMMVVMKMKRCKDGVMEGITEGIVTSEEVFKQIKWICWSEGEAPGVVMVWSRVSSVGIIIFTLLALVTQHFVCLSDLLKLFFCIRLLVLVRMKLESKLPVRLLDVLLC